ncbi:Protein Simiate [Phytophthora citrophthora]|uniref:Protein Simiate n=1 Tax=Phytophthora citrophthora TaxID=4793 RepID=A0AAD9H1J1_9STRA|nr:Protein Simiate [Phytophthora citrophthora]
MTTSLAPPAPNTEAPMASTSSPSSPAPVTKKRRVERRERMRKSALCKHFDKPGGCPFPNCKFAHGRAEVNDNDTHSVAAQRRLIREQAIHRAEEQFQTADAGAVTSKRRGTMIERYYTEMFSCDIKGKPMEDQYVHMHSNRLCVVGVAETHPVMQEELVSVEFTQSVLDSRVTGKKKKGGRFMMPDTVLAVLKCKSGREFKLYSCIRGALIEVNERLQREPELLKQKVSLSSAKKNLSVHVLLANTRWGLLQHQSDGYLVIIQPKKVEVAEIQESLLSKDEYKQFRAISKAKALADEKPTESTLAEAATTNVENEPQVEAVPMEE